MSRHDRLKELARPFPDKHIRDDGRGNSYVPHHVITQRLIQVFGEPPKIEILREIYDGEVLSGVVMRMTLPGLEPIEEIGEAVNPQSKTNGARAKDCVSDGIKRAAMRYGCGLHLWSQQQYYLFDKFDALVKDVPDGDGVSQPAPSGPNVGEGSPETPVLPDGGPSSYTQEDADKDWGSGPRRQLGVTK